MSLPLREVIVILPPSTATSARTPSHFTSYDQRPSSFGSGPVVASIGEIPCGRGVQPEGGGSTRCTIQSCPPVRKNTYVPSTRPPCRTTFTSFSRHFCSS